MQPSVSSSPALPKANGGFTLIELSIVLVIIGLIVGGILTGAELINNASMRAQATQLERYNTAVNTFRSQYGGIPGDLNASLASQFGFTSRSGAQGHGDGNGVLEGACFSSCSQPAYSWDEGGETLFFWEDLSSANYIDGNFNTAIDTGNGTINATTNPSFDAFLPKAKIGNGNYIYTYSINSGNYFGLSVPVQIGLSGNYTSSLGMSVYQAYYVDKKIDDGLPKSGNVIAQYSAGGASPIKYATNAATASSTTCFDTTSLQYSTSQNNGTGINCALTLKMQ
ncbi:MAG TPA: prepilin-type N-terminal cleavage/methylation domain-containing protein [Rickettsiales bacterium]|nr:prepilin-type N-terminal cleavage/methylation domain-containing protein [Rickettsiales bacterium]